MHDILPPKPKDNAEDLRVPLTIHIQKDRGYYQENKSDSKKRGFPWKEIVAGFLVLVFLLCGYLYIKLPRADIQIWPKIETINLSEKITADTSVEVQDALQKIIPAKYVEEEIENWQEFEATGSSSSDENASGVIRVYNKISPATSFTLIKGTHFLSDSGKYFITLEKITIPAATTKSGKVTYGFVDAKVQARESGADYNIGPSKFSIPKLNGTSYYYSIYGESTNDMAGGHTGTVKKVTDEDIQKAKEILTKKLLADAKDLLKSKLVSDEALLDGAAVESVLDASSDVKANTVTDTFHEQAKVKITALVFKKQDVEAILKDDLASQLSDDKKFLEGSLRASYELVTLDAKNGKLTFNGTSSMDAHYDVSSSDLVDLFSMKSGDQITKTVEQMYGGKISQLKINFWPFWVTKAPSNKNRITVNLHFE